MTGEAKLKMARAALELVEPGMTVMVNDGSMAALLGGMLREKRPLTVITNNAVIIDELKGENGINLIALGGTYSAKFNAFFGILTEEALARSAPTLPLSHRLPSTGNWSIAWTKTWCAPSAP